MSNNDLASALVAQHYARDARDAEQQIEHMRAQVSQFFARDTRLQAHIIHSRQSLYVADCTLCLAHIENITFLARMNTQTEQQQQSDVAARDARRIRHHQPLTYLQQLKLTRALMSTQL